MIFGNKDEFSIECNVDRLDTYSKNDSFCHLTTWIKGNMVGDLSDTVLLGSTILSFRESLKYCQSRDDEELFLKSAQDVWDFLEEKLWADPPDEKSTELIEQDNDRYMRFSILANFAESFDGYSAYLIESNGFEKFIWETYQSDEIKFAVVPFGSYQKATQAFVDWYDAL
jgi:hypothetical protein